MDTEWQHLLERAGADIAHGTAQHYGKPQQERHIASTGESVADLSHLPLVRVRGAEAEKFLQGQFTNDMRLVTARQSQLSAYCSPKGRALAITRFFRRNDDYCFALPAALIEPTVSRLRKYVLMSKVTFQTADELVHLGYSDPRGGGHLREALGSELPSAAGDVAEVDGISVIRVPGVTARFELVGTVEQLRPLWQGLVAQAAPIGAGPWEYLDIAAGLPVIYPETMEAFVPQMLNLDILGGISFKKGCYTGQEVVARTHYLGKLKRRMYQLHCNEDAPPAPGTPLFSTALRGDESAGAVVRAQAAPGGGSALLAVLQTDAAAGGGLRLGSLEGPECRMLALPYVLEAER